MRTPKVYRTPKGDVRVAFRDFRGRRYWRTFSREEYERLYGGNKWVPKYEDLPIIASRRRRV